ncbi:ATP synthase F1 subunit epsilon [Erysipelothrix aquatica]|uniref:ATP synthase F1 subunit epsilon n=1 Tax=Erysipelothrix aquatica TaxID=2683714 RepID=UPI00135B26AB|nr:ATP synthase F1 subunit epsilon [Erysipelothrix aquatica]
MFTFKLLTPNGLYRTLEIDSVTLPTTDGQRTMLANHMATVMPIDIGVMYTKTNSEIEKFVVSGGLFTFENNVATLLVSSVESESDIDFERAAKAKARAEERIESNNQQLYDMKRAELALKRSLTRLKLRK